jgi:hypothetical protein
LEFKLRTKVIIEGLNNTQKFRAIINEIMVGDCQVKDLMSSRFPHQAQRAAVWEALVEIAMRKRHGVKMIGFAGVRQGFNVQVDLI